MIAPADDAYAEFAKVRAAVAAARYPDRVDYAVVVSGTDGSKPRSDRYRARYYPETGELRVQTITAEELANPPHPHGFDFSLSMSLCGGNCVTGSDTSHTKSLTPSKAIEDLLGVPFLTPDYSFGIARALARTSAEPVPESSGLKTIAVVSAPQHDYAVTNAGTQTIDGRTAEHLVLKPLRDPNRYRLRDLWVDPTTKLPLRAVIARNFTVAPEDTTPWRVDFKTVDGGLYIASETALATLHMPHGRFVSSATVTFDYKPAPGGVPPIPLDPGRFRSLLEP
ncbi:MAG TPA: sigma-E factor regulatory protein RseB domain-containing protein [Candidatus Acidoferrales bacterium]|nr:sigma-E factor regulatory protein RseB domain-containing protein [Candidatus Acidoferrales bacterium]